MILSSQPDGKCKNKTLQTGWFGLRFHTGGPQAMCALLLLLMSTWLFAYGNDNIFASAHRRLFLEQTNAQEEPADCLRPDILAAGWSYDLGQSSTGY